VDAGRPGRAAGGGAPAGGGGRGRAGRGGGANAPPAPPGATGWHQIRVHLAELGCPVLGDPIYGDRDTRGTTMHLHSRAISLPLYERRPAVLATAAIPEPMATTLAAMGVAKPALSRGVGDAASTAAPAAGPAPPA